MYPVVLVVLACGLASTDAIPQNWTQCSSACACGDSDGGVQAVCRVGRVVTTDLLSLPPQVYKLSLRNNSIQIIERGAFRGLPQLKILDLRDNNLQQWRVDSAQELQALETVMLSGNRDWAPDANILRLCKLKQLQHVSWSMHCKECTLAKPIYGSGNMTAKHDGNSSYDNEDDDTCVMTEDMFLHGGDVTYGKAYEFVKLGFSPQCICQGDMACYKNELDYPYFRRLYNVPRKLFYLQYVLGVGILAMNLVIIIFIVASRALRNSTSFILICSMACSDLLIGVYTLGIAMFNPFNNSTVSPSELPMNNMAECPYIGVVFTTGQATTVFTSLFLTVERYLAIVHCDNPTSRLSTKFSLGGSALVWVVAITFALLPIFGVQELQYHKWFQCTMPFHNGPFIEETSRVTLIIAIGFVLVYLASIGLYIRIYTFVRKASSHLGIKREARLAKRISVVVILNFIFFITPMVLFLVYVYQFMDLLLDVTVTVANFQGFIVMGSWIPVTLFGISSLLNPFLYAFRHQKFHREVRRLSHRISARFGSYHSQGSDRKASVRFTLRSPSWKRNHGSRVRKHEIPNTVEMQLFTEPDNQEAVPTLAP